MAESEIGDARDRWLHLIHHYQGRQPILRGMSHLALGKARPEHRHNTHTGGAVHALYNSAYCPPPQHPHTILLCQQTKINLSEYKKQ